MIGTHVLCVYVEWWSWLLVVLQACHAATFYACVGHATVHACLFVGVQHRLHSRQPRVAQHMKEQFRTICHGSSTCPQQCPCMWIMSLDGVALLRAAAISSRR